MAAAWQKHHPGSLPRGAVWHDWHHLPDPGCPASAPNSAPGEASGQRGGLAASVAHELHKPMVIGCREDDMVAALRRVRELGGGIALVHEGQVLAEIPLPIGGLMSAGSLKDVAAQMEDMKAALREMGCSLEDPVFTLGFLSFSALPWIRLTPSGLLDVRNREILWQ